MSTEEKNFEELMKELEDITTQLEKENLTLDESVELFEKGMKISKECNEKLENAEKRITILINAEVGEEENFIPENSENIE